MLAKNDRGLPTKFFLRSIWLTALILGPYFIITNNLIVDKEWWRNNPDQGLWLSVPWFLILLRRIFKAMNLHV